MRRGCGRKERRAGVEQRRHDPPRLSRGLRHHASRFSPTRAHSVQSLFDVTAVGLMHEYIICEYTTSTRAVCYELGDPCGRTCKKSASSEGDARKLSVVVFVQAGRLKLHGARRSHCPSPPFLHISAPAHSPQRIQQWMTVRPQHQPPRHRRRPRARSLHPRLFPRPACAPTSCMHRAGFAYRHSSSSPGRQLADVAFSIRAAPVLHFVSLGLPSVG